MNLIVMTPVRILGDGLASCLLTREVRVRASVPDLAGLRDALATYAETDAVLVDMTHHVDLEQIRAVALQHPSVAFVALGVLERPQDVVCCGRAGFRSYVSRAASFDQLCQALSDAVVGRLACSAEMSGDLMRALCYGGVDRLVGAAIEALTRREGEVLHLVGRGLSNKEIARELELSVPTVKHHVHNILQKLQVGGRVQAMRRVRDTPWLAISPNAGTGAKRANA